MESENSGSIYIISSVHNIMLLISGAYVSDIVPIPEIKRTVPHSPAYISGICNSYSRNIAMIDLAILLELNNTGISDRNSMMIIISKDSRKIGLLVDRVLSIEPFDNILQNGKSPFVNNFISNICTLKNTNEIAMELDITGILSEI